jgi:multidrug efflux pump subunit AcrB
MWIVRLALRRPLSVAVMALLMLVLGVLSFAMMNVDIFPAINLPVVILIYNYPGLSATDMERRIVLITERAYSLSVNDIQHIESESIEGLGLERVYFQPGTDIGSAIAQLTATSGTVATILPRGTEPPAILSYNAANVPVAQLDIYSDTLSGQQLFDYAYNFIRLQLFTIPGFSSPAPLGGVQRAVLVNLDPTALYANGLSPQDVSNAVAAQSVVIPSGQAKMGDRQYNVDINMNPRSWRSASEWLTASCSSCSPTICARTGAMRSRRRLRPVRRACADSNDRARDGVGHVADGAGGWRRIGTERAVGSRGDRRFALRHSDDALCRPGRLLDFQRPFQRQARTRRRDRVRDLASA